MPVKESGTCHPFIVSARVHAQQSRQYFVVASLSSGRGREGPLNALECILCMRGGILQVGLVRVHGALDRGANEEGAGVGESGGGGEGG